MSMKLAFLLLVSSAVQFGCSGDGGPAPASGNGGSAGNSAVSQQPPPPVASDAPCIISADCPSGTYCDLGQCLQSCSTRTPCPSGLECSARGRCVEARHADTDAPPVTEHAGSISADAVAPELGEVDDSFVLTLNSDVDDVVRYRVEVEAPFLRLQDPERGEFSRSGKLRFRIDHAGLSAAVTTGKLLIHTTLGDVVVNPSLRVGLSGRYQGLLRYTSGKTPLGDVGLVVDMIDDNGDVKVRVDPQHSMTLPELRGAPAAGRGAFTFSQGLSVSVDQVLPANYGGARNLFKRPIGRRLSFSLKPVGRGRLEGTFAEKIHGVLRQPIALSGSVYLEPVAAAGALDFEVPEALEMPAVDAGAFPAASVFPGYTDDSCFVDCAGAADKLACVRTTLEPVYYEPLVSTLSGIRQSADPVGDVATRCEQELALHSTGEYRAAARSCALIPPLACALKYVGQTASFETAELPVARAAYNRLFARSLAPALLVSQNHVVMGLKESFTLGLAAQTERFSKARGVLDAPATFLLASGVLDYLRGLPVEVAKGDSASSDPTVSNFPAARALARLFHVLHTLDGEEARSLAMDVSAAPEQKLVSAQQHGVLAFLEAATLASVLDAWGNPPSVGNEFIGSLTLADRGFVALSQGALVFGVPEGEVPMVFEPARPQPTNFEQFHLGHAKPALDRFTKDQSAFEEADREFEQSASLLNSEIEGVRKSYEDQIKSICGNDFDLSSVRLDSDWALCGAASSGEFAELTLDIQQAYLRLQASQSRIEGMRQKYRIDEQRLADTQKVRKDQIRFIDQNGKALEGLAVQEGIINVAQKTLDVASNANLWNGGAPLAMAAVTGLLEGMRTQITVARQQLQTAQSMRAVADENHIDLINGMADLQKQIVDTAQLELEMEQDALAITQADLRRRNTLDRAKRLFEERLRSLDRISKSPLTDPTYRILQTRLALQAVTSRANAQRALYRAARALEYEINTPLGAALPRAVLGAYNKTEAERLSDCLDAIFREHTTQFGSPQEFVTTISVRDMLGFTAPRRDAVTGEDLSQGRLFRQWILRNENIDAAGNVAITFATNLKPGNGLWSTNVCDDKVASVQAQIVGDFSGDDEAELQIALEGGSVMRRCDSDEMINWGIDAPPPATIQAGVNGFGEARPNALLFGQSVARASWRITIPSKASAPANADLDLEAIDDIVLKITHRALSRRSQSIPLDTSCLGSVGAGS